MFSDVLACFHPQHYSPPSLDVSSLPSEPKLTHSVRRPRSYEFARENDTLCKKILTFVGPYIGRLVFASCVYSL
jgi:hypothetical protein